MAELELLEGVARVPRDEWNALIGEESPFLEWEWLASLEESGSVGGGTGWMPRPLVAREGGRLVGACPLYVKEDGEGEFVFDWSWAEAAQRAGLRYYPKLVVGVPFTPVGGARLLVAPGRERRARAERLARALRDLCLANGISSVHVNFCREEEIAPLRKAGFELRVGLQYHWRNAGYADFDAYLERFRSKRRNQIRREMRSIEQEGVRIETRLGDAIPDSWFDPMFAFYRATVRRYPWSRPYLNRGFFDLLRDRFRNRLCLVVARRGEEAIGGSLNVQKGDALYGRTWGCTHEVRYLHFNVCYYAAVAYCIREGLQRFEPGAGGDYKQARGFDARPTWSLHRIADPALGAAVARFLERERAQARRALLGLQERSALKPSGPGDLRGRRAAPSPAGGASRPRA